MIGSDFKPTILVRSRRCGECSRNMSAGNTYLASIKDGKIKKWVCSEMRRLAFDDSFWQGIAEVNERRRKR